jgi:hypothetical protein
MEYIVNRIGGKTQRVTKGGVEYLVAPATLINPGVLVGNKGPLHYPPEEVSRNPTIWNGMPLTVNHPKQGDQHISARSPEVFIEKTIGFILNTRWDGKLRVDMWFDVKRTNQLDPRIVRSLESGKPLELSTGLFTDNEPSEGVYNGVSYGHIARNYRPDHVAILIDEVGACSNKDGCGVLVNQTSTSNPETVMPLTQEQRTGLVDQLVTNCKCWDDSDKEVLNAFTDDKLQLLAGEITANTPPAQAPATPVAPVAPVVAATPEPVVAPVQPVANVVAPTVPKAVAAPTTDAEWLASAPAGIRNVVTNALQQEAATKAALIADITANEANIFTAEQLGAMDVNGLKGVAALAHKPTPVSNWAGAGTPPVVANQKPVKRDNYLALPKGLHTPKPAEAS